MDQKIIKFLKKNKELFQAPEDQIDWEQIYKLALNDFKDSLGKFTEFWLDRNIHLENYLKELPECFLRKCNNIKEFKIPHSITSIGKKAFYGCTSLTNIVIPISVIMIGNSAFEDCDSLTSVVIPDSVTNIGNYAFYGCISLTSMTIPDSVKSIGNYAFCYCGENLVINYNGTKAQFRTLTNGVFRSTYYTCHCADGDIVKKR